TQAQGEGPGPGANICSALVRGEAAVGVENTAVARRASKGSGPHWLPREGGVPRLPLLRVKRSIRLFSPLPTVFRRPVHFQSPKVVVTPQKSYLYVKGSFQPSPSWPENGFQLPHKKVRFRTTQSQFHTPSKKEIKERKKKAGEGACGSPFHTRCWRWQTKGGGPLPLELGVPLSRNPFPSPSLCGFFLATPAWATLEKVLWEGGPVLLPFRGWEGAWQVDSPIPHPRMESLGTRRGIPGLGEPFPPGVGGKGCF
ncbi:hypothetical protein H1C71_007766, partial [Ictidomys tridecemlineatus]